MIEKFGENLQQLRKIHHVKQKDLCTAIKMDRTKYFAIEYGRRDPSLKEIVQLALFFNVSTDFLLGICENPRW